MMNQDSFSARISFSPDLSESASSAALARLLRPGRILDSRLESYCSRLDERFRVFASTCPLPEWAPGVPVTAEIRCQYEIYLPVAEIKMALSALCRRALYYEPCFAATPLYSSLSWPDAILRLFPMKIPSNPSSLLRQLSASEESRHAFLAALFIPKSFGGGFRRYRGQSEFLQGWLSDRRESLGSKVYILDAACGSGEGAYEAAEMLLGLGYSETLSLVEGVTLEPLELVAAAHGWFPHDRLRSAAFRERLRPLLSSGGGGMIRFIQEDLCQSEKDLNQYEVILCNGLLGGPLLHQKDALAVVIKQLAKRLNPGGVFLAADHFHKGWQKKTPPAVIYNLLAASGLKYVEVGEGIGAVKTG